LATSGDHNLAVDRIRDSLTGYVRKHVEPLIGQVPIGSVTAEVLDSFYVKLCRCRDHCAGTPIRPGTEDSHTCARRCRPHVCRPLKAWAIRKIHYLISGAYEDAIRWYGLTAQPHGPRPQTGSTGS